MPAPFKENIIKRIAVYCLIAIWLCMQVFFLWHKGIVTDLEAEKYIREANNLLNTGHYSSGNFIFYSTQIWLILLITKLLGWGYGVIVGLQILLNGISILLFYKIVHQTTRDEWLSLVGTFYFLIMIYYHEFNTYLFTESIFFSLSVIYTYFLFSTYKLTLKRLVFLSLFLGLLYITRPTGVFFIPATFLYLILKFYRKNAVYILLPASLVVGIGSFILVNYALNSGGEFDFLLPYIDERIICGVPSISGKHIFAIPEDINYNSIQGLYYIVTHYSDIFLRVAFGRLEAFFGVTRSFFSAGHNLFLMCYYYLIYLMILLGLRFVFRRNQPHLWFSFCLVFLMMTTVVLSCDEWSNRFILSVTPFLLLMGIINFKNFEKNIKHDKSEP